MLSQLQDNSILLTYLEEFKNKGFLSSPYFILTFFEELKQQKGLVLLRGDIIDTKITREEGKRLLKELLKFYLTEELYFEYVYKFNHSSDQFDFKKFSELHSIN